MMFKKLYSLRYLLIFALYTVSYNVFSQQPKPLDVDMEIVASVKKDVWIPFMESYRDLNSKKLISIHTSDITRVSINSNKIESGSAYLENIKSFFQRVKKMNREMNITFSIISSATTENTVYQTGYYIFSSRAKGEEFKPRGYSFFNVVLTKDKNSGTWKISLDADKQVQFTQEEFMNSGTIYKLN
jgi:hypothetical protein